MVEQGTDDSTSASASPGKFYLGTILKLFRGSQSGVVRSESGRDVRFVVPHVIFVGPVRRYDQLREGMPVGFDVGWTSGGLRVTLLRAEEWPSGAARELGAGMDSTSGIGSQGE